MACTAICSKVSLKLPLYIVDTLCAHLLLRILWNFLKLYICISHGLKMCMCLDIILRLIFVTFPYFELSHFFFHFFSQQKTVAEYYDNHSSVWSRATEILKSKSVRSTDDVIDVIRTWVRQSQIVTKTLHFHPKVYQKLIIFSDTVQLKPVVSKRSRYNPKSLA